MPPPHHTPSTILALLTLLLTTTTSFCPQYCGCNDTSLSVTCTPSSALRVVPIFLNPQIKSLTLSHNQIKDITLSLQFYQELGHLDVAGNQLGSLGTSNFESLTRLETLNVSYNQVRVLEGAVFTGLGSLKSLDLSGNQVERVEGGVFAGCRNLVEIWMDRNRLEVLDWEWFKGLVKLERISVRFNFIQVLEPSPSVTPTLPRLQTLDVSSNQLTRVKSSSLSSSPSLKSLNLCCNYIHTLEDSAFTSLPSLERVNLSQNRLGRVPTTPLGALGPSLRSLDLSSNRLSGQIPAPAFSSLFSLQYLRLSDNPGITGLHPDSLSEQLNLVSLEADYLPNLTEFSGNLLNNKLQLSRFSLKYGHLTRVPLEVVRDTSDPGGRVLDLGGNPVDCNCSAVELWEYLRHWSEEEDGREWPEVDYFQEKGLNYSQQPYVGGRVGRRTAFYLGGVRCGSPTGLGGVLVKELKESDFSGCFQGSDEFQLVVVLVAGGVVILVVGVVVGKVCCCRGRREGVKDRCGCGGWRDCWGRRKEKEYNGGSGGRDGLFEFRGQGGVGQGIQMGGAGFVSQVHSSPSGKLFYDGNPPILSHTNAYTYAPNGYLQEKDGHTLRHYKACQPLPPLPPYNNGYSKSYHDGNGGSLTASRHRYEDDYEEDYQRQWHYPNPRPDSRTLRGGGRENGQFRGSCSSFGKAEGSGQVPSVLV